jgi:transcriptional regulator with XRE-family HTH domain
VAVLVGQNYHVFMSIKINGSETRRLRECKGWSQESLAQQARLAPRTVQRVEHVGAAHPSTVAAVAAALGVTIAEITDSPTRIQTGTSDAREVQRLRFEVDALRRKSEPRQAPARILAALLIHVNPIAGRHPAAEAESIDPFQDAIVEMKHVLVHFLIDSFDNETQDFGLSLRQRLIESDVAIVGSFGRFHWIPPGVSMLVQDAEIWRRAGDTLRKGFAQVPTATVYAPEDVKLLDLHWKSKERMVVLVGRR